MAPESETPASMTKMDSEGPITPKTPNQTNGPWNWPFRLLYLGDAFGWLLAIMSFATIVYFWGPVLWVPEKKTAGDYFIAVFGVLVLIVDFVTDGRHRPIMVRLGLASIFVCCVPILAETFGNGTNVAAELRKLALSRLGLGGPAPTITETTTPTYTSAYLMKTITKTETITEYVTPTLLCTLSTLTSYEHTVTVFVTIDHNITVSMPYTCPTTSIFSTPSRGIALERGGQQYILN